MNYIEASKLMLEGKLLRREVWKIRQGRYPEWGQHFNEVKRMVETTLTEHVGYDGRFYYKTNLESEGGLVSCNYPASMEDILAEDWVEIPNE